MNGSLISLLSLVLVISFVAAHKHDRFSGQGSRLEARRGIRGRRHLQEFTEAKKSKDDKNKDDQDGEDQRAVLLDGQCAVCTPENKNRPPVLTVRYMGGGPGTISDYQDEEKATCRDQYFPERVNITVYGNVYEAEAGTVITFEGEDGKMDAESDFYFSTGNVSTCFIHTSCSQPLVTGDQIGPFLILEGNGCKYSEAPSVVPSDIPSQTPSDTPSVVPTTEPSLSPSVAPSVHPSPSPTGKPSATPSKAPSTSPSVPPSSSPTEVPSVTPSQNPTMTPSSSPSTSPSDAPSASPTIEPFCGDGKVDDGEECDDGANGNDLDGCRDDCTICECEASGSYDNITGAVTIDFDMCGSEPVRYDWVGIYPCDAPVLTADEEWWNSTVCKQRSDCGDFDLGYIEDQVYVDMRPLWFGYTCGAPVDGGCQTDLGWQWPVTGSITIDPNVGGASWAFPGVPSANRQLPSGCYKVLMNREISVISPPPYPTICAPWEDAIEFHVP